MEGQVRKYNRPASPDRSRVWTEPSVKQQQQPLERKIPVVYYLCRNRHLEHPHFIEVPLSSPDGLYLRDVINRLNVVRGKGMAGMYSWSCKRSYKNGFVWHDLSEDDLVLPALGNEYVLKGSELLDETPPDRLQHNNGNNPKSQSQKHPHQEKTRTRNQEASCSSPPTIVIKEAKTCSSPPLPPPRPPPTTQEEELSLPSHRSASSGSTSPQPRANAHPSSNNGSLSPVEYRVCKPIGAANASTQTEDGAGRRPRCNLNTRTTGVWTDDGSFNIQFTRKHRKHTLRSSKPNAEIERAEISPPPTSSSASSFGSKTETLESLIRADVRKMRSFGALEEEEVLGSAGPTLKAANVLMQLVTCGSISVKDHHGFGLLPAFRPRLSRVKFPSPMFDGSMMLGELDCLAENPRFMGSRLEDKEYFSGSLIETKKQKEEMGDRVPVLKRSSSYNADRTCKSPEPKRDKERAVDSYHTKCLPRTIKMASNKPSRSETIRSRLSEGPRKSSARSDSIMSTSLPSSKGGSRRHTDPSTVKGSSMRLESFKEDKEKLIKIEERLTSGARVIIQSQAPCDYSEDSSGSG